jgi:hypothetical protein
MKPFAGVCQRAGRKLTAAKAGTHYKIRSPRRRVLCIVVGSQSDITVEYLRSGAGKAAQHARTVRRTGKNQLLSN